jgi:hypothetical protein
MSHLRLHEFHAIVDPTKVTHKGTLWWITWQQVCTSQCLEFAAESCRSVIENRRICIWLIILSFRDFFVALSPASGAQWMVTAFDFQRWVRSTAVLHTPADLDRGRMSDKAVSLRTHPHPIGLSFIQTVFSDDGGERSSTLSAVNTRKLLQSTFKRSACSNETHFCGF